MKRCTTIIAIILISHYNFAQQINDSNLFDLRIGEVLECSNYSIKFKSVLEDSRCPEDVDCIWAGKTKNLIVLKKNNSLIEEYILEEGEQINLTAEERNEVFDKNAPPMVSLKFIQLYPYPKKPGEIKKSEYKMLFELTEVLD